MQPLLSRYRAHAEYKGEPNRYNLAAGDHFDADIEVDFEHGYVFLLIIRALPEATLKLRYRNFNDLESFWIIRNIPAPGLTPL